MIFLLWEKRFKIFKLPVYHIPFFLIVVPFFVRDTGDQRDVLPGICLWWWGRWWCSLSWCWLRASLRWWGGELNITSSLSAGRALTDWCPALELPGHPSLCVVGDTDCTCVHWWWRQDIIAPNALTHYNPQTASVSPTFIWPHYQVLTCLQRIFIFSSFLTFTFSRDREYYIIIICGNIIRIIKYVVVVIRKWMKFYLYLVGVIGAKLEKIISVNTVSS